MNDLMSASLATRLTAAQVLSARPDAPVVSADRTPRTARTRSLRHLLAHELRAVAGWVEPRPANSCQPT